MRIAITGIRGIPANYGGFETLIEELAPRLVKRGHDVTVYGRSNAIDFNKEFYKGVRIKILPTISHKYLDTVVHTFLCVIHSFFKRYDLIFICNAANSIFSFLPRISGKKVVVNVDGIERKRKKWNWFGKQWYSLGEKFSVLFPNEIVSDAKVIKQYYKEKYCKDSVFISYGAHVGKTSTMAVLKHFGLSAGEYFLYVSRLEPENNAHLVIKAFEKTSTDKKLVIIGWAPYSNRYISSLKKTKDKRIVFTGYVFGKGYKEFQSHAYCYIHATEVGGTHPALIEAMGAGNCVIANGTPENIEVLNARGLIFEKNDVEDLREKMQFVVDNPNIIIDFGKRAQERIKSKYNWDLVADKYEKLFLELI